MTGRSFKNLFFYTINFLLYTSQLLETHRLHGRDESPTVLSWFCTYLKAFLSFQFS